MFWAERFFINRERPFVSGFGFGVVPFVVVKSGEVNQRGADVRMLRSESLLRDCERAFIQRFGRGVIALIAIERR